jgi:5-methylcytosine-specific restriction endonuclease McrA
MNLQSTLASVCASITAKDLQAARSTLVREAPFQAPCRVGRHYTDRQALAVYRRDGFIDRYSGEKLVFPGTLRLLSLYLPEAFPFHPNWHTAYTHFAYWELCPTLDHVVSVVRGGADTEANWVTTSQLHNSAKGHWLLSELGWHLHPAGDLTAWDGLLSWFMQQAGDDSAAASHPYTRRWLRAAQHPA